MALILSTLMAVSLCTHFSVRYWRKDPIATYLLLSFLGVFFIVPMLYFLIGVDRAENYASDGIFQLHLILNMVLLIVLLQRNAGKHVITRQQLAGRRLHYTKFSIGLSVAIIVLYTIWILKDFRAPTLFTSELSRSEVVLFRAGSASESGSWGFLNRIMQPVAYFALFRLFMAQRPDLRKIGGVVFLVWYILQFAGFVLYGLHRSPIVFLTVSSVLFWNLFRRRIRLLYPLAFLALLLVPIFLSVTADLRSGATIATGRRAFDRVVHGLSGLATAFEFYELKNEIDDSRLRLEYGKQLLYNAVSFVPRLVWPSKPIVSFSYRKTLDLYGPVGPSNWIRTFTIWGEGYAQFGYFGMYLYTLLVPALLVLTKYLWFRWPGFSFSFIQFIVSFPILVRADFFALSSRFLLLVLLIALISFLRATAVQKWHDSYPAQVVIS